MAEQLQCCDGTAAQPKIIFCEYFAGVQWLTDPKKNYYQAEIFRTHTLQFA